MSSSRILRIYSAGSSVQTCFPGWHNERSSEMASSLHRSPVCCDSTSSVVSVAVRFSSKNWINLLAVFKSSALNLVNIRCTDCTVTSIAKSLQTESRQSAWTDSMVASLNGQLNPIYQPIRLACRPMRHRRIRPLCSPWRVSRHAPTARLRPLSEIRGRSFLFLSIPELVIHSE